MARFRIAMMGDPVLVPVELSAQNMTELAALVCQGRFLQGTILDVVDGDGVCSDRNALIAVPRIQMILEDE